MIKQCLILFISNIIFWIQRIGARAYTNTSLVRQQDTYQNSINTDRGRQERGINQSIKTILDQKHEVRPRLVPVSRLNYFSVPAQFSSLSSVLSFVIFIQESSAAKSCCNFDSISIIRHCSSCYCYKEARDPFFV